jgi:hypothetical protein
VRAVDGVQPDAGVPAVLFGAEGSALAGFGLDGEGEDVVAEGQRDVQGVCSVSLLAMKAAAAVAVRTAPVPFSAARSIQCGGRWSCHGRTRPVCLMVNPMNTPIA